MKIIIALLIAVSVASAATVLAEASSYKFQITFSNNASNSSNSNVVLGLVVPNITAPMTASQYSTGACINTAVANYTVAADTTTLLGFGAEWQCHSTCGSLAAVYNAFTFYSGSNFGVTAAGVASTQAALSATATPAGSNGSNDTSIEVMHSYSALTPANLATLGLPNSTQSFYLRCFARFNNVASAALAGGVANLSTTLNGNAKNLTLTNSGYEVAAVLAVAGSLVASLAF
jgi:hypothetical protein